MLRGQPKLFSVTGLCLCILILSYIAYNKVSQSRSVVITTQVDNDQLRDLVAEMVQEHPKVKIIQQLHEKQVAEGRNEIPRIFEKRPVQANAKLVASDGISSLGFVLTTTPEAGAAVEDKGKEEVPGDGFFDPKFIPLDLGLQFVAQPIPKDLIDHVKQMKSPHKRPECSVTKARNNFVYIKTHKTASDTLSAVFRRFAYDRKLSIVLPLGMKYNLGWPYDLVKSFHRPSKTGGFNVLVDHSKYTEKYMKEIMPEDTVYITSWRETFSHLKSAMAYMSIRQWSGITQDPPDGMEVFLQNLQHYDDTYKTLPPANPFRSSYPCIPGDISMAQNSMAADLGFPVGFPKGVYPDYSNNFTAIKEWLEHTNQAFSVVLLSDYFHHSMVMLKRMMCWSTKDILYERLNSWNTKYRPEYRKELVDNFRRWSAADYLAFELFNQTLWDRIEEWGHADFMAELAQYEKTLAIVGEYCLDVRRLGRNDTLPIPASAWSAGFEVTVADCALLHHHMRDTVKQQYDEIPVQVEQPPSKGVPGC
jgi:hypothetical protein